MKISVKASIKIIIFELFANQAHKQGLSHNITDLCGIVQILNLFCC